MTTKPQAVIPTTTAKKPSSYVGFVPSPYYGRMRDGQIVEAEDEREPRYESGWDELRRNEAKRRLAERQDAARTR